MKSLMNFVNDALSRTEMKSITGGCAFKCSGDGWGWSTGMSYASAVNGMNSCPSGYPGRWCCASCP
jgi:hypothetical protein